MDFAKLDPDLSLALEDVGPGKGSLGVWIELARAPDPTEIATLRSLGVAIVPGETTVSTETSPGVLDSLSMLPIVRRLGLAHRLHMLRPR